MSQPEAPHLKILCPHCDQLLMVPISAAGKEGPCPNCKKKIRTPEVVGQVAGPAPVVEVEPELPPGQRNLRVRRPMTSDSQRQKNAGGKNPLDGNRIPKPKPPNGDAMGGIVPAPPAPFSAAPARGAPPRPAHTEMPVHASTPSLQRTAPAPAAFRLTQPLPVQPLATQSVPMRAVHSAPLPPPLAPVMPPPLPASAPANMAPLPPELQRNAPLPPSYPPVGYSPSSAASTHAKVNTVSTVQSVTSSPAFLSLCKAVFGFNTMGFRALVLIVLLTLKFGRFIWGDGDEDTGEDEYGDEMAMMGEHASAGGVSDLPASPFPASPVVSAVKSGQGSATAVVAASSGWQVGKAKDFVDFNFSFTGPDDDWDAQATGWGREGTVVAFQRTHRNKPSRHQIGEAEFIVRVIPEGIEKRLDRNKAVVSVEQNLKLTNPALRVVSRGEERNGQGLIFARLQVDDLQSETGPTQAEIWVYENQGMVYELLTAMPKGTPQMYLSQTARRLTAGFRIIDPSYTLRAAQALTLLDTANAARLVEANYARSRVQPGVDYAKWRTWPGARASLPGNTWNFSNHGGVRFAVAFAPAAGLPNENTRIAQAMSYVWPALRRFDWGPAADLQQSGLAAVRLTGAGVLHGVSGQGELRIVRALDGAMILFGFHAGGLDNMKKVKDALSGVSVRRPANGSEHGFGPLRGGAFQRRLLTGLAAEASAHGRHDEAYGYHEALFERDGLTSDLCNSCRSLSAGGKKETVLPLLEHNERRFYMHSSWLAEKLLLLAEIGQAAESRKVATTLLKGNGLTGSLAALYLETLVTSKAWPEARAVIADLSRLDDSPLWQLYGAIIYAETGERARCAAMIRKVRTSGESVDLNIECVNVLLRCRLYPEALELAQLLTVKHKQSEHLHMLAAECHAALGHTNEARDSWQKALELNPAATRAKEALEQLASSSGQDGTGEVVVGTIPPLPLPSGLAASLPPVAAPIKAPDRAATHLYRVTGVSAQPGQPYRETVRGAIRINDEEGMASLNTMRIPVHPVSQRLTIHHLRVSDAAGRPTSQANTKDYYSLDHADGMATGAKIIHLPVPGLKPGSTIEYAYSIETPDLTAGIDYVRHIFAQDEPCLRDVWYYTGDTTSLKFSSSRGLKPVKDGDSIVFTESNPTVLSGALQTAGSIDALSILHCGIPSTSWETIGHDYIDRIRNRLGDNPALQKAAAEKTANLTTREEKITALSAFVRDSVSYTAIEFGTRAIIPNAAAATLANRYGDCKDHSVLLHKLLSAAGVESRLALINSRGDIQLDFPSLAQFDHMIVALPKPEGDSYDFVDPTNKYLDAVAGAAPMGLQARSALILDAKEPKLARTQPQTPPTTVQLQRQVAIKSGRHAQLHDTISITGTRAASLRSQLSPLNSTERNAVVRQILGLDPLSHRLQSLGIDQLKEPSRPLKLTIAWEAADCVRKDSQGLRLEVPAAGVARLLSPLSSPETAEVDPSIPLLLPCSVRFIAQMQIQPLQGYNADLQAATPPSSGDSSFGKTVLSSSMQGKATLVNWQCQLRAGLVPAEKKSAWHDFARESVRQLEGDWHFSPANIAISTQPDVSQSSRKPQP